MLIKYTEKDVELLARIMRAEAIGEGEIGMLMVGNVVVNRVLADCDIFKNVRSISEVIYQKGQFVGTNSSLFYEGPTEKELDLARRVLRGEYYYPATNALFFNAPGVNKPCKTTYFNNRLVGRYKNHCFYAPKYGECPNVY